MSERVSAYEALQRLHAAQAARKAAKEKWDAAFDKFLDDSQRPLGLCDMMFGLAVVARIVDRALESYKEIQAEVPPEDRTYHEGDTFDELEHWQLREDLFNLYYSHSEITFPDGPDPVPRPVRPSRARSDPGH